MEQTLEIITGENILPTPEKNNTVNSVKRIHFSDNQFTIKDEPIMKIKSDELFPIEKLSGVYLQGVQYYDLTNVQFINHTGMADLIDLLKSLLKKGVEVQFVNVNEKIKNKIKLMGLEHILNCN